MKNKIEKRVGKCLTETKLSNFDEEAAKFKRFVLVSQFKCDLIDLPKKLSDLKGFEYGEEPRLQPGRVTFGVTESDELVWLGEIIDSSD